MIAFVLSGGGNRGALQAGALLALIERGIRPDLIVGTSVGALNGAALAADPTLEGARRLAEQWRRVRRADVFPGNPLTVGWRILTGQGSLHAQANFGRMVHGTLPAGALRFKDLKVPCVVTATALSSGRIRLLGADPDERLLDAILASTAIPPFYPPYRYGDELLIDGAIVANLPLSLAIVRGARTIYALEIVDGMAAGGGAGLFHTLASSLTAMLNRQHEQERRTVALAHQRGVTIHDIALTSGKNLAYNDFGHSAELVEAGRRATLEYLDTLPAARPQPLSRLALRLRSALRPLAAPPAPNTPSA
ncbi:MAG TPA: patatin-like phospholipase family protein [Roseiflexaceae bacterium]